MSVNGEISGDTEFERAQINSTSTGEGKNEEWSFMIYDDM
jgi:hypothetical protein